jgi:hypothetical protein
MGEGVALLTLWSPKGGSGTSVFTAACALVLARGPGVAVVHAAREAARAAAVGDDPSRAARRVLADAEVHVGSRPAVGQPITIEVTYHVRTDVPLVGALFPDLDLHAKAVMRVEK